MLRPMNRIPLLALFACAPPTLEPSIRFTFPESPESSDTAAPVADQVYCSTFMASVVVDNLTLSEEHYGGENVEGEGHWHLLDGTTVLAATWEEYAFISTPLAEGSHILYAQLVQNDHQPFSPDISFLAEIVVDSAAVDDTGTPEYEGCLGGGSGGMAY